MDQQKLSKARKKIREVLDYLKQHDPKTEQKLRDALAELLKIAADETDQVEESLNIPW